MGRINVRTSSDVRSRMRYHAQTNGPLGRNNILGWNGKGKRPPPPDPAGGGEAPPPPGPACSNDVGCESPRRRRRPRGGSCFSEVQLKK